MTGDAVSTGPIGLPAGHSMGRTWKQGLQVFRQDLAAVDYGANGDRRRGLDRAYRASGRRRQFKIAFWPSLIQAKAIDLAVGFQPGFARNLQ